MGFAFMQGQYLRRRTRLPPLPRRSSTGQVTRVTAAQGVGDGERPGVGDDERRMCWPVRPRRAAVLADAAVHGRRPQSAAVTAVCRQPPPPLASRNDAVGGVSAIGGAEAPTGRC